MAARAWGALVEVQGVGVLLGGPSGVGKSECALELVRRGHALVADDVVELERREDGLLWGRAPAVIRHHLELRGIGVVSALELFGPQAVREETPVSLVCHLQPWSPELDVERVGLDQPTEVWGGVELPVFFLPARPATSLASLVEVAVRETRARRRGPSAAQRLDERLRRGATSS